MLYPTLYLVPHALSPFISYIVSLAPSSILLSYRLGHDQINAVLDAGRQGVDRRESAPLHVTEKGRLKKGGTGRRESGVAVCLLSRDERPVGDNPQAERRTYLTQQGTATKP
jgi:hypothetical protein